MGKIAQDILEQIAAANDVVDVIGGYFPLKRAGSTFKALCPFHQEKSPSFTVNPQRQIFKCFGCGVGGGVFKFVELYEHLSFPEAVKKLAARAGIKIIEEELSADDDRKFRMRKRLLALHAAATEFFHQQLLKKASAQLARDYLKSRGITIEVAKAWKLGYAPDAWDAMHGFARTENFSDEELIASGLVKTREEEDHPHAENENLPSFYDRFRSRVMFPICNDLGEVIAFSGRVLQADAKAAKYVNSPETILFIKGNVLFGLHKSKRALIDAGYAIVCEGQLDLITAFEAGIENVIAPQGTAFTEKQARILKRYVEEVVLCFDADSAGDAAAERSLAALLEANMSARIATMPAGQDPDSLIRGAGANAFRALIAQAPDFFDFQIERKTRSPQFATPRGKVVFARKMAEFVGLLSDPVMRQSIAHKVTARLEISARDFQAMLAVRKTSAEKAAPDDSPAILELGPTMHLLCLLALRDPPSRAWLLAQSRQPLREEPNGALIGKILSAEVRAGDASSINAFMATLDAAEAGAVSSMLLEKPPEDPMRVMRDCWNALQRQTIKRRQEAITSRLRMPELPATEVATLQKEVLDLQRQLTDIARPFSTG